jgi:hypothetical protein
VFKYFERFKTYPPFFDKKISKNCGIIVTIPCYDDEDVFLTLNSLNSAQHPKCDTEVIVAVNSAENTPENIVQKNRKIFEKLKTLSAQQNFFFELSPFLLENVAKKIAGVGNARKAAMDEAARHFLQLNKPNGIIAGLDCDCLVSKNYFIEIENNFEQNTDIQLFTFNFQHNFDEKRFSTQEILACKMYETYLRYYRLALLAAGFPHAFHTIGSCFAVTALAYAKAGGMARLQAGEDFYFIHKTVPFAKHGAIKQKIVFPAPRISDRVPFGTGKAVQKIIAENKYLVYNFALFDILKRFFNSFATNTPFPKEIIEYFGEEKLQKIIGEAAANSKYNAQYINRLYTKFNAFFIVRFLNSFNASNAFPPQELTTAAKSLLHQYNISADTFDNIFEKIDKLDFELL